MWVFSKRSYSVLFQGNVEVIYDHLQALISFRPFGGGLTTTQGLDVAMSVLVPAIQFYVVYRGLQEEKTKCILGLVSRTLYPCDSTHMDAASSVATVGFCLFPGCGSAAALLLCIWWRRSTSDKSDEQDRVSPAPSLGALRCGRPATCNYCAEITSKVLKLNSSNLKDICLIITSVCCL